MTIEKDGEELFLAALMDQPETIDDYGDMAGKFSDVVFNALYNAIRDSFAEDGEVSHPAIIERMKDAGVMEPDAVEGLKRVLLTIEKHRGKQSAAVINGLWAQRQALSVMERIRNMEPSEVAAAVPSMMQAFEEVEKSKVKGMADYLKEGFQKDIERNSTPMQTGFSFLDDDGGLYAGLYAIAAAPGTGKTTLCHQIADQVAANGEHSLYFTLEQTPCEMVSKSLSRYATQFCDDFQKSKNALSAKNIRCGLTSPAVNKAIEKYMSDIGNRMTVYSSVFATKVNDVVRIAKAYARKNNVRPLVVVDYLQALSPTIQQDIRLNIDYAMQELKKLANCGFPVIVISSTNRSSNNGEGSNDAFKESSGIEFTADVTYIMQLSVIGTFEKGDSIDQRKRAITEAMARPCRQITLKRQKNRFGQCGNNIRFNYYPQHDLFVEVDKEKAPY